MAPCVVSVFTKVKLDMPSFFHGFRVARFASLHTRTRRVGAEESNILRPAPYVAPDLRNLNHSFSFLRSRAAGAAVVDGRNSQCQITAARSFASASRVTGSASC